MRKAVWIVALLVIVAWVSAEEPATKPTAQPKPATKAPSAHAETAKRALAGGFNSLIEKVGESGIDWTESTVFAKGRGESKSNNAQDVAMAKRAARLVAARNAILVMNKIRVDAEGRFARVKEGVISVEGVLENFKEVTSDYNPESRTATVVLQAPLHGAGGVVELLGAKLPIDAGESLDFAGEDFGTGGDVVIVDARGVKFAPSLGLRIVTADGRRVFSLADVRPGERLSRPLAVYVYMEETGVRRDAGSYIIRPIGKAKAVTASAGRIDPDLQRKSRKGFRRPIIVAAEMTPKNSHGTIVLSGAAMRNLAIGGGAHKLMKAGKIVVVTDSAAGPVLRANR